jgi:hypothetical protein
MKQIALLITLSATATCAASKSASAAAVAQPSPMELARIRAEKAQAAARHQNSVNPASASAHAPAARPDIMEHLARAGRGLGIAISQITPTVNTHGQNAASSQAAGTEASNSDGDIKMAVAAQNASSSAAAQRPVETYPGSHPLPNFTPLSASSKQDIDSFIRLNLPLMKARIRYLQQSFYACVRDILDDAVLIDKMLRLKIVAQQSPPNPLVFLFMAREKFLTRYGFKDAPALVNFLEAEKKAFASRYRAVDSTIESAGAAESFEEVVNDECMLQSEGLSEAEIKYFETIGLETSGEDTKEGSLIYWISCNTCQANFKAGWNNHYYHKPTCRFYQQFNFNPNIADKNQQLVHVLQAIDHLAHNTPQPDYALQTWNLLHELRNSVAWNGPRWELFLNYSKEDFEEDRQETFNQAVAQHTDMQLDS